MIWYQWLKKSFLSHLIFGILEYYYAQKFNKLLSDTLEKNIPMIMKNFKLLFLFLVILFIPTEAKRRGGVLVGIFGGDWELSWSLIIVSIVSILMCICKFCNCDDEKEMKSNPTILGCLWKNIKFSGQILGVVLKKFGEVVVVAFSKAGSRMA